MPNLLLVAQNAHKRGDLAKAERIYRKILRREFHPFAAAALGTICIQKGQTGHAEHFLKRAVASDEAFHDAHNNLGVALRKLGKLDEAIEHYRKSLLLFPDSPAIQTNLGSTLFDAGEFAEAEKVLSIALEQSPDNVDANWNMGLCRLAQGKYDDKTWDYHEWGFRAGERLARPYANDFIEWEGQDLDGKTILIWGEQGLGDELLFANCLPDLKGNVLFDCHPRLVNLFRESFPHITSVGTRKSDDIGWMDEYAIDYHCPIGNLPRYLRADGFPDTPYLKAEPKPKTGTRIGIAWRGGAPKTGGMERSLNLEDFAPFIADHPDLEWVSLQYTGHMSPATAKEVARVNDVHGLNIVHDDYVLEDLDETASLIASCDLVISVVQTAVHLAGGLGVETWCLTPIHPPWKFPKQGRMVWHPSVALYRQEERNRWGNILDKVRADLGTWRRHHGDGPGSGRP